MLKRLFPIHRPHVGISISSSAITMVQLQRPWCRTPVVQKMVERPLSEGLLRPSPTMPHIVNVAVFTKELGLLTEHISDRVIALSLPTQGTHMGVFRFDTFPHDPKEREALIKWRFREEHHLALNQARIVMHVFSEGPTTQVVAVAVHPDVLAQYEAVCSEAGLIPVAVGFSPFQLHDLYRPLMKPNRRFCVVQWEDNEFMLMMFKHAKPVFLRTRSMAKGVQALRREVLGTLQYIADQSQTPSDVRESPFPLYLISGQSKDSISQVLGRELALKVQGVGWEWQVEIVPLGWEAVPVQLTGPVDSLNGLSAVASVVAS